MEFNGFKVREDGFAPFAANVEALRQFSRPQNITEVRAWFGLVEQVSFAFSKNKEMELFRELPPYAVWMGGAPSTLARGFVLGVSRGIQLWRGALGSPVSAGEDEVLDSGLSRPDALHGPQASGCQTGLGEEPQAAAHSGEEYAEMEIQCHSRLREEEQNQRRPVKISLG